MKMFAFQLLFSLLLFGCSIPTEEYVQVDATLQATILNNNTNAPISDRNYQFSGYKAKGEEVLRSTEYQDRPTDVYGRAYFHIGYKLHPGEHIKLCVFTPGPGNQCQSISYEEAVAFAKPDGEERRAAITKTITVLTDFYTSKAG